MVGALAAIFNCIGRVFWGHFCDVSSAICFLYSTLYLTEFGQKATFAVWIWAIFSFCGNFVLLPTASALCFGTKYHSKNYGLVMTGQAIGGLVSALLTQVQSRMIRI